MPHSHTLSTVKKVERLWQDHSASEVAEMTGVPRSTVHRYIYEYTSAS